MGTAQCSQSVPHPVHSNRSMTVSHHECAALTAARGVVCWCLPRYAASEPGVVQQLLERHAFEKFVESITKVAELHGDIAAISLVEMYVALMRFTDSVHPDKLSNVNRVLGACQRGLAGK